MQVTSRRAVTRPQFDLFRALECAREARFDISHTKKQPRPAAANRSPVRQLGA